jgi:Zn-dependent peptidase ImmA (M78 family)
MIRAREARNRARQLLKMAGVSAPPVDVHRIAEFLGFTVIPFGFPDSIHGVTYIEGTVRSIGINQREPPTRQRFSIAHEIGHFLSGHEAYDDTKTHVEDHPGWLSSHNRQEIEANEFAAELLMPEPFLRRDVAQAGLNVPTLARRYQVSEQALWIQLIDLKLANQYAKS